MKRVAPRPGQPASGVHRMLLLGCALVWSPGQVLAAAESATPVQPAATPAATPAVTPAILPAAKPVANQECLDCHEAEFKSRKRGLPKEWVGVRPELFAKSVHGKLNCVDCHNKIGRAHV